jgi:hypothetical protein
MGSNLIGPSQKLAFVVERLAHIEAELATANERLRGLEPCNAQELDTMPHLFDREGLCTHCRVARPGGGWSTEAYRPPPPVRATGTPHGVVGCVRHPTVSLTCAECETVVRRRHYGEFGKEPTDFVLEEHAKDISVAYNGTPIRSRAAFFARRSVLIDRLGIVAVDGTEWPIREAVAAARTKQQ